MKKKLKDNKGNEKQKNIEWPQYKNIWRKPTS